THRDGDPSQDDKRKCVHDLRTSVTPTPPFIKVRLVTDAYVIDALRTPIGRYGGALANARPDDLAAHVVRSLVERSPQLDPAELDDVFFGDANAAGEDNRDVARMAVLLAGLPTSVPGV